MSIPSTVKLEARQAADAEYDEIVVNYKMRDVVGLLIFGKGELDNVPFLAAIQGHAGAQRERPTQNRPV